MKLKTRLALLKAKRKAEKEVGFKIPREVADEVLAYCIRKLPYIKKDESYLPLLYRCELPMQLQIKAINAVTFARMKARKEEEENVRCLQTESVSLSMS